METECYRLQFRKSLEGTAMIRPRRSLLFMPGSNARALEKARNLAADGLILDLEDAVAPTPRRWRATRSRRRWRHAGSASVRC